MIALRSRLWEKGHVVIQAKGNSTQTIFDVLFVPDLRTNLLSIGQLQDKGYKVLIKNRVQNSKQQSGLDF